MLAGGVLVVLFWMRWDEGGLTPRDMLQIAGL